MHEDEISVAEAARILGVHDDTVRRLYDDGEIDGRRTSARRGGWRRLLRSSVEAYKLAQERGPDGDSAAG